MTASSIHVYATIISQMNLKELILDDNDISKAIIEYATSNAITDIVVGASTKNTFIRYT